jgi:tRNA (guanine37-N1)-methyltransferase
LERRYSRFLSSLTADEILAATLPSDIGEVPRSYTIVGHIAHVNLDESHLPYKYHIGSVILSKGNKYGITTVVNKLDIIDSTYRNFAMEVIAGEENYLVTQSHLDCEFQFDFSKVYWNTRLGTEHRRLVDMFAEGEAVADVFAGVGPFAVPAGKKRVFVLANDLNPDSYGSMEGNIIHNKVFMLESLCNGRSTSLSRLLMKTDGSLSGFRQNA